MLGLGALSEYPLADIDRRPAVGGPYHVGEADTYRAGSTAGETHRAGSVAGQADGRSE